MFGINELSEEIGFNNETYYYISRNAPKDFV